MKGLFFALISFIAIPLSAQVRPEIVMAASSDWAEDSPALSPDGKRLYFLRSNSDEWPELVYREVYVLDMVEGVQPKALGIDSVYTLSVGIDGESLFISRRIVRPADEEMMLFQARKRSQGWQLINLTERDGLKASYAQQVSDGSLYFFQYDGLNGTGIYRSQWNGKRFETPVWQGLALSPPYTTAFSPYVCPDEKEMLLTIFFEEDGEAGRTGIYHAKRTANGWQKLQIKSLPYGWSASIDPEWQWLYYTDGEDILKAGMAELDLPFSCTRQ